MKHRRLGPICLACTLTSALALALFFRGHAVGQQMHRNGFEARETVWVKGMADAPFEVNVHEITDLTAHGGLTSEHLQLTMENGSYVYYEYNPGKAPITDELSMSTWVKANRPGVQILARVVLPNERDPKNLDRRLTTLVRGESYQLVGRWQRLEVRRPTKLAKEQQQLMRAELKRDVDFTDAYVDRIFLNLYAGPGLTEVWIDDLEVSPVLDAPATAAMEAMPGPKAGLQRPAPNQRHSLVELNQDHLLVGGKRFFFRGIRHTETPLEVLRDAGFNALCVDYTAPPETLEKAIDYGFWLVPTLPVTTAEAQLGSPGLLNQQVTRFLAGDAVLFWDLGNGLVAEQAPKVAQAAQVIHQADPKRPVGADVWDGFLPYSRTLDLVATHRWPLMTMLELPKYREWLNQRRLLGRPGTFQWTWIQTHAPDWYTNLVYDRPGNANFDEPIGPQPEQIRLLTYTALASGCRGLGFWSDRFLADSHQGRGRLLTVAMLNQEMQMLEPMLVSADQPRWIDTSVPEVKAAVMRCDRGMLVLPMWLGKGAQFVPGQSATPRLTMVVPEVPIGSQAWEVLPAEVRSLPGERVPGGTKITVPEFNLTTAIVFTSDNSPTGLLVRFQNQCRRMRKQAAQWAHDLAESELERVTKVCEELDQTGHKLPDMQRLLSRSRASLQSCVDQWNRGNYGEAYTEAERSLRPLRILMRAYWEKAVREIDLPVSSPYALSFYTLPKHFRFTDQLKQSTVGMNLLAGGDFESSGISLPSGWSPQLVTVDDVELMVQSVPTDSIKTGQSSAPANGPAYQPNLGQHCLMLQVKAKKPDLNSPASTPTAALERTYVSVTTAPVALPPGTLVKISGLIHVPAGIGGTVDGALFHDSIGGEPMAVRLTNATVWRPFALYRVVPPSGSLTVTMGLSGIGTVYFDDIRVEPMIPNGPMPSSAAANSQPPAP